MTLYTVTAEFEIEATSPEEAEERLYDIVNSTADGVDTNVFVLKVMQWSDVYETGDTPIG